MIIDTHCHLSSNDYEDLDKVINNMSGIMIASGCEDKSNTEVLNLVNKYENVYGTLGFHPEEIQNITNDSFCIIKNNLKNKKIVAIGEIGLDYYWTKDNIEEQKMLFEYQLKLAEEYNKPVIVHSREAIQDTYDILKKHKVTGTIHSYSGSLEMAREFVKLGFKIGIGGVVTFKNAKKIQEIVKEINLEDILLETDSPYLTPEPYRGKRNEPANVYYVALKVAELKNINVDEVLQVTTRSAIEKFDLEK